MSEECTVGKEERIRQGGKGRRVKGRHQGMTKAQKVARMIEAIGRNMLEHDQGGGERGSKECWTGEMTSERKKRM